MPAALVGSVILTIRGRGVGRSELINKVGWLREAIVARGGRVAEFAGMDMASVVDRALLVLKDLIGEHKNLLEPTFYPINRFAVSFSITVFFADSLLFLDSNSASIGIRSCTCSSPNACFLPPSTPKSKLEESPPLNE